MLGLCLVSGRHVDPHFGNHCGQRKVLYSEELTFQTFVPHGTRIGPLTNTSCTLNNFKAAMTRGKPLFSPSSLSVESKNSQRGRLYIIVMDIPLQCVCVCVCVCVC